MIGAKVLAKAKISNSMSLALGVRYQRLGRGDADKRDELASP